MRTTHRITFTNHGADQIPILKKHKDEKRASHLTP